MSKGYFINKWFAIDEKIRQEMNSLFPKNNVPYLEVNLLPAADKARWFELKKKCDRISDNVCKIIMSK